jgi:DUF3006 family protein
MAKQRNDSSGKSGGMHRWAVDQVEEGTAAVEQDGDHVYEIPRWLLPPDARDGDVFSASSSMNDEGSLIITVRLDEDATGAAKAPRPKRARPPRGPSGDIVL